ncbi:NADP-dependent phosphogluconate dehydrogenase [Catenovulum agarivorans]|uniref:NADP-dependent phosphogluconate dehydrogenase n=1 Tax=Catenovulum agarivorans TaxID=1172192 RepID=UPI0003182DD2|nr:NADP-dependent phosphogluconate dehydrogenase [Catenovulum agarivorans]
MSSTTQQCQIGLIGLGVMGKNLGLNLADNGYSVAAFDLDAEKVQGILSQDEVERGDQPARITGCTSFEDMLSKLEKPYLIILSIPAGKPVDIVCGKLMECGLSQDDIVVDTGNSLWTDTVEREAQYNGKFIFFSCAVSGGEVGARFGPSLMPSGDQAGWARLEPVLEAISAKVDPNTGLPLVNNEPGNPVKEGEPCAAYIGPTGAGHYVKMVHNGIEYADMQLICEAYDSLRSALGLTPKEIAAIFREWNKGPLNSYLIEISAEVLDQDDPVTGEPLVDKILDVAGQKGTGLWTAIGSLEVGSPAMAVTASVYARALSGLKDNRVKASGILKGPEVTQVADSEKEAYIQRVHDALYCSKICAYAQGFELMKTAGKQQGWDLDFAAIAKIWRAGCIIRAVFLQSITDAFNKDKELPNLLMDDFFAGQIEKFQSSWRESIVDGVRLGVAMPCFTSSLAYYDSYRSETTAANLLQGQRDFFGAHTFERVDQPRGQFYHLNWSSDREIVRIK